MFAAGILFGTILTIILSHQLAKQSTENILPKKSCISNNIVYKHGEKIQDGCNSCTCENGQVTCTQKACNTNSSLAAPQGNACSEDAFVCPNNSSVGRSGPSCSFDACPYAPAKLLNEKTIVGEHFSIKIPQDWKNETQQMNEGHITQTTISGPEGELMLSTGTGFGGACDNTWTKIKIAHETLEGCYGQLPNGSWEIKQINKQLSKDNWFDGRIVIHAGVGGMNAATVMTIVSTLTLNK